MKENTEIDLMKVNVLVKQSLRRSGLEYRMVAISVLQGLGNAFRCLEQIVCSCLDLSK